MRILRFCKYCKDQIGMTKGNFQTVNTLLISVLQKCSHRLPWSLPEKFENTSTIGRVFFYFQEIWSHFEIKTGATFVNIFRHTYSQTPAGIIRDQPVFVQTVAWLHGGQLCLFSWVAFSLTFNKITGHLNPREISLQSMEVHLHCG